MFQKSCLLHFLLTQSAMAGSRWDATLNTCSTDQTLIKSKSFTTTKTTDDCEEFCLDEIYQYSLANPSDYTDQQFCCEYSKVAAARGAADPFEYVCKNYVGEVRYDKFSSTCADMIATDSQGNTCSWYP